MLGDIDAMLADFDATGGFDYSSRLDDLEDEDVAPRDLDSIIAEEPAAIKALEGAVTRKKLDGLLALRRAFYEARLAAGSTKNREVKSAYADYQAARQQLAREVTRSMESTKKSPVTGRMLQQFWLSDQGLENTFRAMELKAKSERKFEFIGALADALDRTPFGKALKFIMMGVVAGTLASDTPKAPVEAPFRVESVESLGRMPSVPQAPPLAEAPVAPEVVIAHDEAELLTDADIAELTKQPPVAPPQTIKGEPFDNEGLWQPDSTREEGK